MKTRSSWSASPTASPPATATSRTPQGLQGGRAARRGPLLFGGMASRGFAMQRPFRGLVVAGLPLLASRCGGLSGALPVRAARAARGRSARLAAPGAPPGLRPGWREPTRSTAEPTAARAEPRAAAAGPRVQARCRLREGAEASRSGDRRRARIARRSPVRTERAPRGDRAERGSRVGERSRSGRLRRSAPHGAGGHRGAASRGAEGPRQGPEDHRRKQPRSKGKPCERVPGARGTAVRLRPRFALRAALGGARPAPYPRPGGGRAAISRAKAFRASQSGARSGTRAESGESARRRPSPRAGSRWGAGL